jgi:hypothetical protein
MTIKVTIETSEIKFTYEDQFHYKDNCDRHNVSTLKEIVDSALTETINGTIKIIQARPMVLNTEDK